jgi:hypothetical protein
MINGLIIAHKGVFVPLFLLPTNLNMYFLSFYVNRNEVHLTFANHSLKINVSPFGGFNRNVKRRL